MDAVLNRGDLCTESVFATQADLQSLRIFLSARGGTVGPVLQKDEVFAPSAS